MSGLLQARVYGGSRFGGCSTCKKLGHSNGGVKRLGHTNGVVRRLGMSQGHTGAKHHSVMEVRPNC